MHAYKKFVYLHQILCTHNKFFFSGIFPSFTKILRYLLLNTQ